MAVGTSVPATRELRGLKLARERGEEIEHLGRGWWRVPGCSGGSYRVNLAILGGEQSCECPDFGHRGEPCKHLYAAIVVRAKRQAKGRREAAERREGRLPVSPDRIAAIFERTGA